MKLKNTINLLAITVTLLAAPFARAFTYTNGDVLLIFRTASGLNNIEFNLGNIGQFLNQTNGYTVAISNWNPGVVTGYYPLTSGDAQFLVLATDGTNTSWVSDSQPLIPVTDFTPSKWQAGVNGPIQATGIGAAQASLVYSLAPPATNYEIFPLPSPGASFDGIAGTSGDTGIPYLGGGVLNFEATAVSPTTVLFYKLQASSVSPKPAGTLIGSFSLDAAGNLTFQAGPLLAVPQIVLIAPTVSNGGATLISVGLNSKAAVKYRLRYTTQLATPRSLWTILPYPIAGDGGVLDLYDNSPSDPARFYSVESY